MTDTVRLHNIVLHTRVLGPGDRAAVWFQGCMRCCKGCMSPSSRPLNEGMPASISKICRAILDQHGLEGITVSGGEPFLQPGALESMLAALRKESNLGVIVYTGYTLEQLRDMDDPCIQRILDGFIDLLIDGEYVEEQNDGKSLKGSSNQRLIYLTDRYRPFAYLYGGNNRDVEVRLSAGEAFLIGIPNQETWRQWQGALAQLNEETKRHGEKI